MNTTAASKGPIEARLGTKLRDMSDRIRNLENRRVTTIGGWRLREDEDGNLIAAHPSTGATQILVLAQPKENT